MGDQRDVNEFASSEAIAGDAADKSNPTANGDSVDKTQTNGDSLLHPPSTGKSEVGDDSEETSAKVESAPPQSKPGNVNGASDANPDKSTSTAEDTTASMLPADPKNEEAISGGAALAGENGELGSILKGSPFEKEGEQAGNANSLKPKPGPAPSPSSKPQHKSLTMGPANGKPKEGQTPKSSIQSKTNTISSTTSTESKPAPPATPKGETTSSEKKPQAPSLDGPAETQADPAQLEKAGHKTTPAPRTPTSNTASTKQPSPIKPSPKAVPSKDQKKEPNGIKKSIARPSTVSKPPTAVPSKIESNSSTGRPVKKLEPASPKPASTKPRPKSPTRLVRLPAAATAPTAASAAKLDGAPPSSNDRKSTPSSSVKDKAPTNPEKPQPKSARTSLPSASRPADKSKPPRMSMASSKAPEGSFLERMMRPTQSSSQKTHEKKDLRSPPTKGQAPKPKRISQGSDRSKSELDKGKGELPKEQAAEPTRAEEPAESSNAAETNAESKPADGSNPTAEEIKE